jgi:predicted permease
MRFVRELWQRPGFLLVAVITLGVGIGANAAIFSVVDAVLIRPLPYPDSDRLVAVWGTAPGLKMTRIAQSDGIYVLFRKENRVLAEMGIYQEGAVTLTGQSAPERVGVAGVTASVFSVLRVPPARGRTLQEADEKPGAPRVAVLSDGLWRRRFGGDPAAVGGTLRVDGVERQIVGVMPAGFRFPAADDELWIPITIDPARLRPTDFNYTAIGRLGRGVETARATRELTALIWRIPEVYGEKDLSRGMIESAHLGVSVVPLRDEVVGAVARVLWVLLGSVGCILLIACANVGNLFLVRAERRQRELAVRTALGATQGDVARLFLGESLAVSLLGGLLGLALAWAGVRLLVSVRPPGIPRLEEVGVAGRVLLFTILLSLFAGLLCGAFAALRTRLSALVPALKEGGSGGTVGRARHRARSALIVTEVALALVLLVGSGLMIKSFQRLRTVDPGFDPHGVLTLRLDLPAAEYRDSAAILRFQQRLLERVRALPGVTAAGTAFPLPLSGSTPSSGTWIEDFPPGDGQVWPQLGTRFVSPGTFSALRIPVIEGRVFDRLDPAQRATDIVVNKALAERYWPGASALGKRLSLDRPGEGIWYTIVGVVGDVHDAGLESPPTPSIYYPMVRVSSEEWAPRSISLVVRGGGTPAAFVAPIRAVVRSLDPNLPLAQVRPMSEVVERSIARTSFTMLLLVAAAAVALVLGSVGIYSVIAYVVSQRTREIGVRMALGATRHDVSRMVLGEGLAITSLGIAVGLAGALALTRLMLALLFGVSPTDPTTFVAVPALLTGVALLASWVPARRAARVEPLVAIRCE